MRGGARRIVEGSSGTPSERTLRLRRTLVLGGWIAGSALLLLRAANLQVVEASHWRAEAERQHQHQAEVPAPRGAILDRNGLSLALSHEAFRVGVAPHELADRGEAIRLLSEVLDLSPAEANRATDTSRRWVAVPGRFPPSVREALGGVRGVYVERELRRFYPHDGLARGLLGGVIDEAGAGGIEQAFEDHLRGMPGAEVVARDSDGRPIPGETWRTRAPESGGAVVLTLDAALQEIANEALRDAVATTGARGGDLLVTDPRTGEILAMASHREGEPTHLGAIHTPYEPGSTLKPFTVATLLRERKASLADSVDTGSGRWVVHGRVLEDVAPEGGFMTLAHALQVSSNVGIARVAQVLAPDEQYEALRDFGFGVPTGLPLPGEAAGTLRRPADWSRQSAASLSIGYEIAVTPLQMAMAYGALANGGVLMEPRLVRELRDGEGRVVERFEPRPVRRVIDEAVAEEITATLVGAVETGTGTRARLSTFTVAGKSGTSRMYGAGGYEQGAYFASFVGFFPAEDPQLVVFVKLERPQGTYYGGATAAPVTRATLEAILAARTPPLDRAALAAIAQAPRGTAASSDVVRPASAEPASVADRAEATAEPLPALTPAGRVVVPDVRGLTPRAAARRLHWSGLAVLWESAATVTGTLPAPGTEVLPGDTIRLLPTVAAGVAARSAAADD